MNRINHRSEPSKVYVNNKEGYNTRIFERNFFDTRFVNIPNVKPRHMFDNYAENRQNAINTYKEQRHKQQPIREVFNNRPMAGIINFANNNTTSNITYNTISNGVSNVDFNNKDLSFWINKMSK